MNPHVRSASVGESPKSHLNRSPSHQCLDPLYTRGLGRVDLRNRIVGRHTSDDWDDKEHDNKDRQLRTLDEDPGRGEVGNEDPDEHSLR